jgi:hypothetical protein
VGPPLLRCIISELNSKSVRNTLPEQQKIAQYRSGNSAGAASQNHAKDCSRAARLMFPAAFIHLA